MVLTVNVVNAALITLILGWYAEHAGRWIFFGFVVTLTELWPEVGDGVTG